jgi:hypothetical protein
VADAAGYDASGLPDAPIPLPDSGGHVLRGAFANADAAGGTGAGDETKVEALEAVVGTIDLELSYHGFAVPFPTTAEAAALAHNRVPVVSLGCGDTNKNIAAGMQDVTLKKLATAMREAKKPIVLRWFWEMNLIDTANGRSACWDKSYDIVADGGATGYFDPTEYIAAWRHIHDVVAMEGATNVAMFFCPSGGAPTTAEKYYPGDAYVEINGFDVYDRTNGTLDETLAAPYAVAKAAAPTKVIWVGETGAFPVVQNGDAGYISGETRTMLAAKYPLVGAIEYFDAVGPAGNWSFTADGLKGFKAFGP